MFHYLVESSWDRRRRKPGTVLLSVLAHAVVVAVILLIPLIYYQALPEQELVTLLLAPSPAPPLTLPPGGPAPKGTPVVPPDPDRLFAPPEIPVEIPAPEYDIPIVPVLDFPVTGGIPGGAGDGVGDGVPWGVPKGERGGLLDGVRVEPPPLPPTERKPGKPLPVGGNVQNSKLVSKVLPTYPELAKRARVDGIVLLQVSVDETGTVGEVRLIRGHPLLYQAAIDAVRQWRYSPTLLNGEPIPVVATVTVNFVLE